MHNRSKLVSIIIVYFNQFSLICNLFQWIRYGRKEMLNFNHWTDQRYLGSMEKKECFHRVDNKVKIRKSILVIELKSCLWVRDGVGIKR